MNHRTNREQTIIEAVKYLLNAAGATRKQLAEYIGQHPSTISDRLNGKTDITIPDLDALASFFDVGFDVLFKTEDELDQWLADDPTRRRKLRQRVAVIDLTDTADNRLNPPYRCTKTYGQYDLAAALTASELVLQ